MENEAGRRVTGLKNDVSTYAGLRFRLLKLMAVEKGAVAGAFVVYGVLLGGLLFLVLLFFLVALALVVGEWWDSLPLGFLGSGVVCVVVSVIVWMVRKSVRMKLVNWFLTVWYVYDNANGDEKQQRDPLETVEPRERGVTAAVSSE